MALADYVLSYELPFKDIDGNQWRVRIYDRDAVAPVTPERLKGTGSPVQITYDGDEDFTQGIIGSSCVISVYGTPNQDGTSDLSQFFVADEERFYVLVEWTNDNINYNTYWKGFLHQDEYREHITSDPYMVELVAFDRLGTIKARLDELGYNYDSTPLLANIVQDFIDETKLEFTLVDDSGLVRNGGNTVSFLYDQNVLAETFMESRDEFVRMKPVSEVVSNMAVATGCLVYQANGNLYFSSIKDYPLVPTFKSIGSDIITIGDNLYARHRPAKRVTNMSIEVGGANTLTNPSFERDAVGETNPTGWTIPATTIAGSVEVSDEAYDAGSLKSLKTVNNRRSDSDFNSDSVADKNSLMTLLEASSDLIELNILEDLQGLLRFKFFINNTQNLTAYEIRFSMERNNSVSDYYYNFEEQFWNTSFSYGFFETESTGDWQEIEIPFTLRGGNFYNITSPTGSTDRIVFRIHIMNYNDDGSLSNVEVFYDNFELRIYNAGRESSSSLLPTSQFYNLSTDADTSVKSGSTDITTDQGLSTVAIKLNNVAKTNTFNLLNGKVLGQYTNSTTGDPDDFEIGTLITPSYLPLPSKIMELRADFDSTSKKYYEGTIATPTSVSPWTPISYHDKININYTSFSDLLLKRFVRFDFDVKGNRYDIEAVNVPS